MREGEGEGEKEEEEAVSPFSSSSAAISRRYKFVSLHSNVQQSRTGQIQPSRLICPSLRLLWEVPGGFGGGGSGERGRSGGSGKRRRIPLDDGGSHQEGTSANRHTALVNQSGSGSLRPRSLSLVLSASVFRQEMDKFSKPKSGRNATLDFLLPLTLQG